jgi:hypothetical protein
VDYTWVFLIPLYCPFDAIACDADYSGSNLSSFFDRLIVDLCNPLRHLVGVSSLEDDINQFV